MFFNRHLINAVLIGSIWLALMVYWQLSHPVTNPLIFFGTLIGLSAYMLASYFEFLQRVTYSDSKTLTLLGWIVALGFMSLFAILLTPIYCGYSIFRWHQAREGQDGQE